MRGRLRGTATRGAEALKLDPEVTDCGVAIVQDHEMWRLEVSDNEFILMAGDGYPLDAAAHQGDCVFMPLPLDPALFDEDPYLFLPEHRAAGEHRYHLSFDG